MGKLVRTFERFYESLFKELTFFDLKKAELTHTSMPEASEQHTIR